MLVKLLICIDLLNANQLGQTASESDSKSGIRFSRIEGSNPSCSAKTKPQVMESLGFFFAFLSRFHRGSS